MSEDGETGQPTRAVRLLFRMRDGVPELVSRQTVEMVLPEEDEEPAAEMGAAMAFELRDADQRPLLARALDDQIHTSHEVFSPEAIGRVEDPAPSGAFEVIVPDVPGAEFGALVAADPNLGAAMGGNELTFRLSDIPEDDDLDDGPAHDDEGGEP
ncbi:MAG TPA: hypothetical protein VFR37_04900 [Longimicrobium sp.]|nr:hypothetical protein [Longimicrobium sp.]